MIFNYNIFPKIIKLFIILFIISLGKLYAQVTDHGGSDWTPGSQTVSGTHINVGTFYVSSGVTLTVSAVDHYFEVHAVTIVVDGTINATGAGDVGGSGGSGGGMAWGDNRGGYGGAGGSAGAGSGGGATGQTGGNGSYEHSNCGFLCIGGYDSYTTGGGGGGGGGAGGYGGSGGYGSYSGAGSSITTVHGTYLSGGAWVNGGGSGSAYGNPSDYNITWGSGGGGGGGGGGAYSNGSAGGNGGPGGGEIALYASGNVSIVGTLLSNGKTGGNGGNASGCSMDNSFRCYITPGGMFSGSADGYGNPCGICYAYYFYDIAGGAGGGAGGGSGGGILIQSQGVVNITGSLQATGGTGGSAGLPDPTTGNCFDYAKGGAGGGGGRIKIITNPCYSHVITPNESVSGGSGGYGFYNGNVGLAGSYVQNIIEPTYTTLTGGTIVLTDPQFCVSGDVPMITEGSAASGGIPGVYTYAWEYSTVSAAGPFGGNLTNTSYYDPGVITQTIWFRRKVISGNCTAYSNVVVASVNPNPAAPVINGNLNGCANNISTFSVTSTAGHNYLWSTSSGSIQGPNNNSSVNILWGGSGSYTITLTDFVSSTGCNASTTANINVNPVPSPSVQGPGTACETSTQTYTTALVGGHSYNWNVTGGTIATGQGTNQITVTWGAAGSGSVSVTEQITSSGCQLTNVLSVIINPLPVVSQSAVGDICIDSSPFTLTGGLPAGGVYTGSGVVNGVFSPSAAGAGSHTITYSYTNSNLCTNSTTFNIVVHALPVVTFTQPARICISSSPVVLSGGSPIGGTYSGPGVTGGTFDPVSAGIGAHIIAYTYTDGYTCTNGAQATITVDDIPVPNPGTGGDACGLNNTFNAVQSVGTGVWTMTSGTGTASYSPNASAPNATVTVTDYGQKTFTWTVTNGACMNSASINVNFIQQPSANAGTGGNECDLNFNLNATPTIGSGSWAMVSGTGTATFNPGPTNPHATVIVTTYGSKQFRWTETNNICSSNATITVNFYQPPVANAGQGGNICGLAYPLNAVPSVGAGTWTMVSGTGSVSFSPNANAANATATVTAYGAKQFRWTEINGTCSNSATITVNFYQSPVANAGPTGNASCNSLQYSLNATPTIGVGVWTLNSGAGTVVFGNTNSPQSSVTVSSYGSYVFTWTETNGICTSAANTTVNFYQRPVPDPGSGGNECDLNFVLNATPGIGNGIWSMTSGTGSASFNPAASNPNATVTVTLYGTKEFTWTVTNGTCNVDSSITVIFYQQPDANAGSDNSICQLLQYNLHALQNVGTGAWTMLSGPGTVSFSPAAVDPNAIVTVDNYGRYIFLWTEINGICSDTASVRIAFNPNPEVIVTPGNSSLCEGQNTTLTISSDHAGTTYAWNDGSSTNPLIVSPSFTTVYTVTGTDIHNCSDTASALVVVHNNPVVSITPSNPSICEKDSVLLTASGANTYTWSPSSSLTSSSGNSVKAFPSETTTYMVTGTGDFGCINTSSALVTVNLYPEVNLGEDLYICSRESITLDAGGDNLSYRWQDGTISRYYYIAQAGSYWVTASNNGCATTDTIRILECHDVKFPNAFSPNGDGYNDIFRPEGNYLETYKLSIFNRWGKLIFETEDISKGWDGKINGNDCAPGVYFWAVDYKRAGYIPDAGEQKLTGSVTLLR